VLAEPCWRGRAENAACGDVLELSFSLAGRRIDRAMFQARGCSAVIASASLATEALVGRSLREALELDFAGLIEAAGGLAPRRAHAARVVQRAVREAVSGAMAAPVVRTDS
jgi:nitrogen fixation NifU-like protein